MLSDLRKKTFGSSSSHLITSDNSSGNNRHASHNEVLEQAYDFEVALKSMDYLLDDRTEEGRKLLRENMARHKAKDTDHPLAVYKLAFGVMEFIEATVGFEPEVMERARNTLADTENAALANTKYNVKNEMETSHMFASGTEFQVVYAELTLLHALLMILQENNGILEISKALLKLRRAYQILEGLQRKIENVEASHKKKIAKTKVEVGNDTSFKNLSIMDLPGSSLASIKHIVLSNESQDFLVKEKLAVLFHLKASRITGSHLGEISEDEEAKLGTEEQGFNSLYRKNWGLSLRYDEGKTGLDLQSASFASQDIFSTSHSKDDTDESDSEFCEALDCFVLDYIEPPKENRKEADQNSGQQIYLSTIDEFIQSGVQLCFGVLQVVLSLIPPAIGKVLSVVGYKGDRELGLKMLWQTAVSRRNVHGLMALLFLAVYYDGPVQFFDDNYEFPAKEKRVGDGLVFNDFEREMTEKDFNIVFESPHYHIAQLIKEAKRHFPNNALWVLEEGRGLAYKGELSSAIKTMQRFTDNPSSSFQMQQIEALFVFDRALLYAFKHMYDEAASDFIYMTKINNWSSAVFFYFAASCYLSKMRMIEMGMCEVENEEESLRYYGHLAEKYFKEAPNYVPGHGNKASRKAGSNGRNKKMPFDFFLLRKLEQVKERQKAHPELSFLNCFGTSPIHELIYFWNAYKKMGKEELELSLRVLAYSGAPDKEYSANTGERSYTKLTESLEEAIIRYFLQSVILRRLNKIEQGNDLLDKYVLASYGQLITKVSKSSYSPYLYPTLLYEKSLFVWTKEVHRSSVETALKESRKLIQKADAVSNAGDYELRNRTSMTIKAAGDRLDQLEELYSRH